MLINSILKNSQLFFNKYYQKSFILKNIDWFIFVNLILVIISSTFVSSDFIAYFAIFIIILTIIKLLVKPNEIFKLSFADLFLLLYFLITLISVFGSSLFFLSLKGFSKTLIYISFYISFVHYLKDNRNKLKYILLAIAISAFAESIIALKQNFLSVAEISGWQDMSRLNPEEVMTRVYGSIKPYNPNLFGGYMLSVLPSMLVLIFVPLINKYYKFAIFGFFCFLLCANSIIMTGCRGAYLGLFIEFILIILFTYKFLKPVYKKLFLFITGIFSLMVSGFIVTKASLRARIFSIFAMRGDSSNSFRFNVYNSCIDMFKDNWLLGIGIGNQNFREIYGLYMKTGFDALSAYNIYLELAVESGIFALITFISFIAINIISAIRYILQRNNFNMLYLTIAVISISGILIHGIVDTVFFRPQIQFIFWIMIGIIRVITTPRGIYVRTRD